RRSTRPRRWSPRPQASVPPSSPPRTATASPPSRGSWATCSGSGRARSCPATRRAGGAAGGGTRSRSTTSRRSEPPGAPHVRAHRSAATTRRFVVWSRSSRPSVPRTFVTCVSTVLRLTPSDAAIPSLDSPLASSSSTRCSPCVSVVPVAPCGPSPASSTPTRSTSEPERSVQPDQPTHRLDALDLDRLAPHERLRREPQREVLGHLVLAPLPRDAVVDVADLAADGDRRRVVEERARGDLDGVAVVEGERADRLPHPGADAPALVRHAEPGAGLTGAGDEVVLGGDPLRAHQLAVEPDAEVETPRLGREPRPDTPVELRHLARQVLGRGLGPRVVEGHPVGRGDTPHGQLAEADEVVVGQSAQLEVARTDPQPERGEEVAGRGHRRSLAKGAGRTQAVSTAGSVRGCPPTTPARCSTWRSHATGRPRWHVASTRSRRAATRSPRRVSSISACRTSWPASRHGSTPTSPSRWSGRRSTQACSPRPCGSSPATRPTRAASCSRTCTARCPWPPSPPSTVSGWRAAGSSWAERPRLSPPRQAVGVAAAPTRRSVPSGRL